MFLTFQKNNNELKRCDQYAVEGGSSSPFNNKSELKRCDQYALGGGCSSPFIK